MDEKRLENEDLVREQVSEGFAPPPDGVGLEGEPPARPKMAGLFSRLRNYFRAGSESPAGDGLLPFPEPKPAGGTDEDEDRMAEPSGMPEEGASLSVAEMTAEVPVMAGPSEGPETEQEQGMVLSTAEQGPALQTKMVGFSMLGQMKKDVKEFAARIMARQKTGRNAAPASDSAGEAGSSVEDTTMDTVPAEGMLDMTPRSPGQEIQPAEAAEEQSAADPTPIAATPAGLELDGPLAEKETVFAKIQEGVSAIGAFSSEWVKRILHKEPELPIDESLALKLSQKKALDEEIRVRRRETAHTLKRLNRSKKERKELLRYQAKIKGELEQILATMRARSKDVSGLEKQSLALQREIEESSGRHGQLLNQIQSAKTDLETVLSVIGQHKAQSEIVDGELAAKQNSLSALMSQLEQAKTGLDSIRAETAVLHGEKDATEQARNELKGQIDRLEQERAEKNRQLETTLQQLEQKQKEADEKLHQSMVLEGVLDGLRLDLRSSQESLQSDKDQASSLEASIREGRSRQDDLNSQLEQLQNQVSQQQQALYLLKNETENLNRARSETEENLRQKQEELTGAESLLVERNRQVASLEKGIEELQQGTANRQNIQQLLQQKIEGLKSDGLAVARKIDEMTRQKQSMEAGLEQAWKKLSEAETKISLRENFRIEAEEKLQKLQAEIRSAFSQIEALKQERIQLDGSREISSQQLEELNRSIAGIQQNQMKAAGELQRTRESLVQAQEEYDKLSEDRSALQNEINQKKTECAALEDRDQKLQDSVNESLSRLGQTGEEQQKLSAQVSGLEDELQRLKDEVKQLNQSGRELSQAREMLQKQKLEVEQWIQEAVPFQKQQQQQIEQQLARIKELQEQASGIGKQVEEGRLELEEINQQNQALMQERAQSTMTAESELASLHQQIGQKNGELEGIAERMNSARSQNRQMEEESAMIRSVLDELKEKREQAQLELQEAQRNLVQAREDLEHRLKSQNEELVQMAQETESAKNQIKQQLASVQNQLDDKYRQLDDVNEMVRQNEGELSAKQRQRDELDQLLAGLKNDQKQAQSFKEEWDKNMAGLTRELEEKQKAVSQKSEEEAAVLKRLKMLSAEASEYQARSKELNEIYRKIEDQKRVLEDLELQAEKKSGLFS